ncbi:hypothetical protein K9N68_17115 [Kovacikia minuta CCNUW1]|uniref:hypothetical protein n=1 Tax=Kovacikia minuta TaxID=2931930 RepID=UPI001CCAD998|nr:hypothetical protein [Kovacikia minuta]UBF29399.1 hypothetical protein K9N68_17115 [Kovacikia minuta CCNUW1]
MDLDQQIQALIKNAPQDGTTPTLVEAIAPVLMDLAAQLRHLEYYIPQTLEQDWAITTLESRSDPPVEKTVIYAYPTLKDVAQSPYPIQDPQMIALPVPVTHILFQMLAMEAVDSTIFFEVPGNVINGTEIQREQLTQLIQFHLSNQQTGTGSTLPPNIA